MRRTGALLAGFWTLAAAVVAAAGLQVTPLARDGQVYVSFELSDGFSDDLRAAMHSGLTTTFSYDVDLRRSATLWFDHTLASAAVSASVKYDTLTRKYNLTRAVDGRIERADVTDTEAAARAWLTQVDKLALCATNTLEPNVEYYLRVRAHTSPRTAWFLWPWDRHEASGTAKFTLLR
jgi:hypothetical protein